MRCPPRPELMAEKIAYSPETLIKAYALGVFPMADGANSPDIHFYDPDMRALIPLELSGPNALHIRAACAGRCARTGFASLSTMPLPR